MRYVKILAVWGALLALTSPAIANSEAHHHHKGQGIGTIVVQKIVKGKCVNVCLWRFYVNDVLVGTGGNGFVGTFTAHEHGQDVGNTVSEQPVSGTANYTASVVCVSDEEGVVATGGSSTNPGDVSLKNGETVTCTFTNTFKTTLPPPPPPVHHHHHHHKVVHHKHAPKLPPPVTISVQEAASLGGGG